MIKDRIGQDYAGISRSKVKRTLLDKLARMADLGRRQHPLAANFHASCLGGFHPGTGSLDN